MHIDPETLQRALDGELDPAAEARVRANLATCEECARRLRDAGEEERRVVTLLETLDHDLPAVDVRPILEAGSRHQWWKSRIAASVAFLVVAGGLAYAVPGSPVREWIRATLSDEPLPSDSGVGRPPLESTSGISVDPGDSLDVVFESPQESGTIQVRTTAARDLDLRIIGGAPGIRVETHRVRVANAGSTSSYRIEIPESAPLVRVRVGARQVFMKYGPTITAAGRDSAGGHTIPLGD